MKVGSIGCGMMGQALTGGMVRKGVIGKGDLMVSDPFTKFETIPWIAEYEVKTTQANEDVVKFADILFIAVKPFMLECMVKELKGKNPKPFAGKLVVSMVAAYSLAQYEQLDLGTDQIVRIMPNTPCLVEEGAIAICPSPNCTRENAAIVGKLLNTVGKSWVIPENRMDVWTCTAGAGPAYVFQFMEGLADAAVVGGLPRDAANEMAAQVVAGSAKLAAQSEDHFALLKDKVCSPNGVTIAGVQSLKEHAFQGIIMRAIKDARTRNEEINRDPNA